MLSRAVSLMGSVGWCMVRECLYGFGGNMAVKIRLKRTGGKNDACFRVVAADERSPRDGKNLEVLGWYNPGAVGDTFSLKIDRIDYWLGVGAQISDTAASLLRKARKVKVIGSGDEQVTAADETVVETTVEQEPAAVEEVETAASDAN